MLELVVVVVILGVLAAVAVPKFLDFGKSARVAAVTAAIGSISSAANGANVVCLLSGGCQLTGQNFITGPTGNTDRFARGFPAGKGSSGAWYGISDWVVLSGFTIVESASNQMTDFMKDDAPDPTNCKVSYWDGAILYTTTTGC